MCNSSNVNSKERSFKISNIFKYLVLIFAFIFLGTAGSQKEVRAGYGYNDGGPIHSERVAFWMNVGIAANMKGGVNVCIGSAACSYYEVYDGRYLNAIIVDVTRNSSWIQIRYKDMP